MAALEEGERVTVTGGREDKWSVECCSEWADGSFVILESSEERVKIIVIREDGMSGLMGSFNQDEMNAAGFLAQTEFGRRVEIIKRAVSLDESFQWKASIERDNRLYLTIESALITMSLQLEETTDYI